MLGLKLNHVSKRGPWRRHMATEIWVNWRHQANTWTSADFSSVWSTDIYLRITSQQIPQPPITKISLKFKYFKFTRNLPGADEFPVEFKNKLLVRVLSLSRKDGAFVALAVHRYYSDTVLTRDRCCYDNNMCCWYSVTTRRSFIKWVWIIWPVITYWYINKANLRDLKAATGL